MADTEIQESMYFVAFCDILGFSSVVESRRLQDVINDNLSFFRCALEFSLKRDEFPNEPTTLADLQANDHVGFMWFSDSVLIFSRRDEDSAIRAVLQTVEWLIWTTVSAGTSLIRGGLAYGPAFIDTRNALFVGLPIVEAAKLEYRQAWAGAALAPSAVERLPEHARTGELADWPVRQYDVPLRNRTTERMLAVEWTWGIHPPGFEMRWSREHADPTVEDWQARPDVCTKFVNTRRFHDTGRCCGTLGRS